MSQRMSIEGVLVERVFDAGTRAERRGFAVVDDAGVETPVHVVGDNPFESPTLRQLLGSRIATSGAMRGRTLRVTSEALRPSVPADSSAGVSPDPLGTTPVAGADTAVLDERESFSKPSTRIPEEP